MIWRSPVPAWRITAGLSRRKGSLFFCAAKCRSWPITTHRGLSDGVESSSASPIREHIPSLDAAAENPLSCVDRRSSHRPFMLIRIAALALVLNAGLISGAPSARAQDCCARGIEIDRKAADKKVILTSRPGNHSASSQRQYLPLHRLSSVRCKNHGRTDADRKGGALMAEAGKIHSPPAGRQKNGRISG